MYGTSGNIKDISHMSLYSKDFAFLIPEPGTLALVALAMLGLAIVLRRRRV
jgi:hypothetical protein